MKKAKLLLSLVCLLLLLPVFGQSQVVVKNPSGLAFLCPDHASDTSHEIDIVRESDGTVVQTLVVGDPPLNTQGEVEFSLNVQPIAFGAYRFQARALASTFRSDTSLPSAVWERVPGKPSGLVVR